MTTSLSIAQQGVPDVALCRRWIAHHSKSFYLSSLMLPREARQASWALYAFCRRADDAVDEGSGAALLEARVAALRARLDRVYAGTLPALESLEPPDPPEPPDPIDRAYARVASRYGIPRGVPEALLAGMEMDVQGVRYATWDELMIYCFRVAATVGLMMTCAMAEPGRKRPDPRSDTMLRAAELGVAMQLTNIARDVGEDARRGRVYLPDELLAACGTDRDAVLAVREATGPAAGATAAPIREATRRLLLRADDFYRSAERGIALLPRGCRLAIGSARYIYSAIGTEIARAGFDSVTRRAHTSLPRKLLLVGRALPWLLASPGRRGEGPADALLCAHIRAAGLEVEP